MNFGSAQQQGGVVAEPGESHKKFSGFFVGFTFVGRSFFCLVDRSLTKPAACYPGQIRGG